MAGDEPVSIIGGAEIFELFLPLADRLELTEVLDDVQGDTVMPDPRRSGDWREVAREEHAAEGETPAFAFVTLERALAVSTLRPGPRNCGSGRSVAPGRRRRRRQLLRPAFGEAGGSIVHRHLRAARDPLELDVHRRRPSPRRARARASLSGRCACRGRRRRYACAPRRRRSRRSQKQPPRLSARLRLAASPL